jgi:hypothetical protein
MYNEGNLTQYNLHMMPFRDSLPQGPKPNSQINLDGISKMLLTT